MTKVVDFQKCKAAKAGKTPQAAQAHPEIPHKKRGNTVVRLLKKAFWHSLSAAATWIYSVASALGVAITLLAKFALVMSTIILAFAFFYSEQPDYDRIREVALWYPVIIGGCLAYKGFVYLLFRLASHLSETANKRT